MLMRFIRASTTRRSNSLCVIAVRVFGFGDSESVHHVVVDVDEGVLAVVHSGDELRELVHFGLMAIVLACVVLDVGCHTSHQGQTQGEVVPCLGGIDLVPRQPTVLGRVRAVGHIKLDDAEHLDAHFIQGVGNVVVVAHVRGDASVVVLVVTSEGDVDVVLSMVDVDAHLILAVFVKELLDVLLCESPLGEELAGGVGVPFEESCDSVDYCILFHAD